MAGSTVVEKDGQIQLVLFAPLVPSPLDLVVCCFWRGGHQVLAKTWIRVWAHETDIAVPLVLGLANHC